MRHREGAKSAMHDCIVVVVVVIHVIERRNYGSADFNGL